MDALHSFGHYRQLHTTKFLTGHGTKGNNLRKSPLIFFWGGIRPIRELLGINFSVFFYVDTLNSSDKPHQLRTAEFFTGRGSNESLK